MTMQVLTALGGVGMFLLGMEVMTAALRDLAGGGVRRRLAGLTSSPLRGALTGALATGLIQSSSAVTLITIGAVGAGLLGFSQALGVLLGANVGTTVTGWMVMVLGLKLKLGVVALPVLFAASLLTLLGQGTAARMGRALAGFALLFIGLDMMQTATAGAEALLHPGMLPEDTWPGRLVLVALGLGLVALIQSSSAGMALALVLLGSGAISFAQAAALVIGFDMGTTVTGLLAALGGGRAMRLTAMANLLFNVGTALLAFPLLDLVVPVLRGVGQGADDQIALVIFHTGFNLIGAAIFLPFTKEFAALVARLVRERPVPLAEGLDRRLLADPGAALDAAQAVADRLRREIFAALAAVLGPTGDLRALAAIQSQGQPAVTALERYLASVHIAPDRRAEHVRYAALLHQIDHFQRLLDRCAQRDRIATLGQDPLLRRDVAALATELARGARAARLTRLASLIDRRAARFRRAVILREHAGLLPVSEVFDRTDAMRWLGRVSDHAARLSLHAEEAKAAP
ncbi:MAG: Na/Pi cotransporter family protein [Rhodobacteraceae bacterium CG17_big_fil_post_rev_8_21_14_2_50_63_15]|nr:Na/Pi cotransporter family protein [Roseovarius sp.]PIV79733.1 MAG: Na/Pi cotransporter family protein [Rhodobacteraceae bacterium CG17_big_fil_post_rev_8_21_14_2_50_63_15]